MLTLADFSFPGYPQGVTNLKKSSTLPKPRKPVASTPTASKQKPPNLNPETPPPDFPLQEVQAKLDHILDLLARLKLRRIKLPFEDPQDHSIRLLDPDEVAYILTSREDMNRRGSASATARSETVEAAGTTRLTGDDSLTVYTVTGQTYRSYATLGDLRARLQGFSAFVPTHRSYLVNLDHAVRVEITPSGRKVYFAGVDLPAEVSRDNVREVDQYLGL